MEPREGLEQLPALRVDTAASAAVVPGRLALALAEQQL
jgi:hypothetical protein